MVNDCSTFDRNSQLLILNSKLIIHHSALNDFTGFAIADRIVWMLNVNKAMTIIIIPLAANIHHDTEVR